MDSPTLLADADKGLEAKLNGQVEKKEDAEPFPVAVVNVKFMSDGKRTIEAFGPGGASLTIGRTRDIIEECLRHQNDRVMAAMVQSEVAKKIKEAMQATKDRNLWARLLNVIH